MINIHTFSGRMGNEMFRHAYLYAQVREGIIPDVYLQDPKYFEKYASEIKEIFGQGIGYLEQVGIHIRRGANPINPDEPKYSENPFYFNLEDISYYEQAMEFFPNEKFVVFSDDIGWCLNKFKDNPNVQVMDKGNEVDDFNLFASTKHQIISNSSWSWWGAYLCSNEGHKVIAPSREHWYRDGIERTICPQDWIRI